jgi:hypothetical protein
MGKRLQFLIFGRRRTRLKEELTYQVIYTEFMEELAKYPASFALDN